MYGQDALPIAAKAGTEMAGLSAPLLQRLWKSRPHPSDVLRITPRNPGAHVPLAFAQEPMWVAELFDPGDPTYNQFEALRLRGNVDPATLQAALDRIVQRHEILRTAFRSVDGEPAQIVLPSGTFPLETLERQDLAAGDAELDALCAAFVRRPFDFTAGRLTRALLVRLSSADSVLVLVLHHIVRDGWAMGVLLAELGEIVARGASLPDALPALPIQYGDVAVWQQYIAGTGAFDEQRAYWEARLHDAPPVLDLPADRRRSTSAIEGRQCAIEIPLATVTALRALAKSESASFFMTLAAAFQTFVYRYTGVDDLVTGFPVSGRLVPETEPLIGCFINTVVLRTAIEASATFRALLASVRRDALEAYANQDFPFRKLVELLRPERRAGQGPIVQTMVTLVDPRRPKLRLPNVLIEPYPLVPETAKVDLALEMLEHAGGLSARFEYRRDLFDDATARAMLDHFGVLLHAIAENPDRGLETLPIVAQAQREQLFALLHGPDRPRRERCIDELVRERSVQQPEATAVICGPERITYAELDRAAERLAQRLSAAGATRDTLVAVLCEPSIAMVVAVLAVLKAGAAYLPLDARYPPARLRSVIDDARPIVALADAQHAVRLSRFVETLPIDDGAATGYNLATPVQRDASDLAYVIYTSGTTGEPKGVEVEHRSVATYLDAVIDAYGLNANDVVLQFTSLSFDTSVQDIFATLVAGATLAVATPEMRVSPVELMQGCARLGVTLFDLPAAYWQVLVDDVIAGRVHVPPALRLAVAGGEPMNPAAARAWIERTGVRLINAYGPTETTISATLHEVVAVDDAAVTVPVGRALPNVHLYLLDAELGPVPRGAIGQLYIGGSGVARGYRQRPELTRRTFVPDLAHDGTRMYATGDLARIDGQGLLHILGRDDGQVKIRGFRIETSEIEAALLRHAAVRACAVAVHEDAAGTRRLVAHVVAANGSSIDGAAIETHLRASLPDYMIPAIAPIAALPLTVGGKIDRAALPAPAATRTERALEPRDDLERALVALWEELLDSTPIGVRDNFFALGGHSLLAARMATLVERQLGMRLPVSSLFAAQTIEEIAALLRRGSDGELRPVLQLQAGGDRAPLYFLHGDYEGGGLYCTRLAAGLGRDQPLFVVRPHGYEDGPNVPPIEAMAADRVAAIRALQPAGPYVLGGYCIGGAVALEMARQFVAAGDDVPLVVLVDAPLGLRARPALRLALRTTAALLRWSPERETRAYVRWHRRITHLASLRPNERIDRVVRAARRGLAEHTDATGTLAQSYSETIERYRPTRYAGRVLMINSRADESGSPIDWSAIAPAAALTVLDSDHQALVRDHGSAVGERIRREIDLLGDQTRTIASEPPER